MSRQFTCFTALHKKIKLSFVQIFPHLNSFFIDSEGRYILPCMTEIRVCEQHAMRDSSVDRASR